MNFKLKIYKLIVLFFFTLFIWLYILNDSNILANNFSLNVKDVIDNSKVLNKEKIDETKVKKNKFKTDEELKNEVQFTYGELESELDSKNYKKIFKKSFAKSKIELKPQPIVEQVFKPIPKEKVNKADYTLNGELSWYLAYKKINRLDSDLMPAFNYTNFNFWIDSKDEKSKFKEHFYLKVKSYFYDEREKDLKGIILDECFTKFSINMFDFKFGNIIESLGSGDNFSFIDLLNPRYYYKGLVADYNEDKKAVLMFKNKIYLSNQINIETHFLPFFERSELADFKGSWSTNLQKYLANFTLNGGIINDLYKKNDSSTLQLHTSINGLFEQFEIKAHYFKLKENLPIVSFVQNNIITLDYPEFEVLALDGNVNLGNDYLLRGELALYKSRTYNTFDKFKLSNPFKSDQLSGLLGIDRTFANGLYINLQGFFSHIYDLIVPASNQKFRSESGMTLRVQKNYKKDKYKIEFQNFTNFRTSEYFIKTFLEYKSSDMIKYVIGKHINDGGYEHMGIISEFYDNNHTFFQVRISF